MPNIFVRAWRRKKAEYQIKEFSLSHGNLFITTGLISLLNTMAIIKQENLKNNYLIVYSAILTDSFKKVSQKIILKNFFERVIYLDNIGFDAFIKKIDLNCFDNLFIANQPQFNFYQQHSHINLIEEGIGSYFDFGNLSVKGLKNIYLSNFLDKVYYDNIHLIPFVKKIKKENQLAIIKEIRRKKHINFPCLNRKNQILLMHHYTLKDIMNEEECLRFYITEIDALIQKGYNILFKPHPRVDSLFLKGLNNYYKNRKSFKFFPLKINYPIEILIPDIKPVALLSCMSGSGLSCSHLYDIPSYEFGHDILKYVGILEKYRKLLKEVQLPIEKL